MERAEKLSITLPASLARVVRESVESGEYASNSEVIRTALRAWQARELERLLPGLDLKAAIEEAINDPRPPKPAKEVFARLQKLHRATVKARGRGR